MKSKSEQISWALRSSRHVNGSRRLPARYYFALFLAIVAMQAHSGELLDGWQGRRSRQEAIGNVTENTPTLLHAYERVGRREKWANEAPQESVQRGRKLELSGRLWTGPITPAPATILPVAARQNDMRTMGAGRGAYDDLITEVALEQGVAPALVHAIVGVESAYRPDARSSKGAVGLMQLMPQTAERFGTLDRTDPRSNLQAGTRYISWLLTRFNQDVTLALAAYNAGEGAVDKYGGQVPPYAETQSYVQKVLQHYQDPVNSPPGPIVRPPTRAGEAKAPASTALVERTDDRPMGSVLAMLSDFVQAALYTSPDSTATSEHVQAIAR